MSPCRRCGGASGGRGAYSERLSALQATPVAGVRESDSFLLDRSAYHPAGSAPTAWRTASQRHEEQSAANAS
jgi:hypothetical protein